MTNVETNLNWHRKSYIIQFRKTKLKKNQHISTKCAIFKKNQKNNIKLNKPFEMRIPCDSQIII